MTENLGSDHPALDSKSVANLGSADSQLSFSSIFSDSPIGPAINDQASTSSTGNASDSTATKSLQSDTGATNTHLGELTIMDDYGLALTDDGEAGLDSHQDNSRPTTTAAPEARESGFLTFSDPFAGFNSASGLMDYGGGSANG